MAGKARRKVFGKRHAILRVGDEAVIRDTVTGTLVADTGQAKMNVGDWATIRSADSLGESSAATTPSPATRSAA